MTSFSSSVDASTLKEFQAIVESFLPQHGTVRFSKLSLHVMYRDPKYRDKQLRQKLFNALQDAGVMWIGQDPENQVGEAVAGRGRAPPETNNKQKRYNDPAVVAASPSSTPASKTKIRNFILSRLPQSEAHDGTKFIPFVNFVFKADKTNSFSTIEELIQYTDLLALEGVIWKKKDPLTQELKIGVVFDKKKTSSKLQQNNTSYKNSAAASSSPSSSTPVSFEEATSAFWEEIRRFLPDDNIGIQESVFVERLLRHTPYSFLREKEVRSSCLDFFLSKKQNMIERYFVARTTTYLRLTSKGRIAVAEQGQVLDHKNSDQNDDKNNSDDDDDDDDHSALPDEVLVRFMHLVKLIVPADDEGASQSDVGTFIVEHCESDDDKYSMLKIKKIRHQCFKRCFEMGFLEQYAPDEMKYHLTWVRFPFKTRHFNVSLASSVAIKVWMVARALIVPPSSTAAAADGGSNDHGCHFAPLIDHLLASVPALVPRESVSELVDLLYHIGFISKKRGDFLSLGPAGRRIEDWAWQAGLLSRGPTGPPFLKTTTAESLYKVEFLTEFTNCEESSTAMAAINRVALPDKRRFRNQFEEILGLMKEYGEQTVGFERLLQRRDLGERGYWRLPAYEKEAPSAAAARVKSFFGYYREIKTRHESTQEDQPRHHSSLSGDRAKVLDSISNAMHSALGSDPPVALHLAFDSSFFLIGFAVENTTSPAAEKNLPPLSLELSHSLLLAKRYAHPVSILGDTLKSSITLRKSQKYYYRLGVYCLIYDDMIPCLTREEFDEVTYTSKYDGCDAVAVCYDENGNFCREFKNKAYIYFNVKDPKKQMLKIARIDVEATD